MRSHIFLATPTSAFVKRAMQPIPLPAPHILVILQAARQTLDAQPISAGHRTLALRTLYAVFRHRWMDVIGERERVGGKGVRVEYSW